MKGKIERHHSKTEKRVTNNICSKEQKKYIPLLDRVEEGKILRSLLKSLLVLGYLPKIGSVRSRPRWQF